MIRLYCNGTGVFLYQSVSKLSRVINLITAGADLSYLVVTFRVIMDILFSE